jgi:glutamate/aspartate transport system substrate-binding protein
MTHFLTASRYVTKKSSNIHSIDDLKGKTIVSTAGTTNIKQATDTNTAKNMGMNIIPANGHPEAFQMVETGRAVAFVMDDVILATLVAQARNPADYVISNDAFSLPEPYGIMMRKDDPSFKKLVDATITNVYKSGEINKIYAKWFTSPTPPKGLNYNMPMSSQMKNAFANPTDSGDPTVYK